MQVSPPRTIRYCRKCGVKNEYISSGLFRVNAQKKTLDVWLVYRCRDCNSTWNSAILSRVNRASISADALKAYMENDSQLASRCAMDSALLKRNGAEVEAQGFTVAGLDLHHSHEAAIVKISCLHPEGLRLAQVIRQKLRLSNRAFGALVESGALTCMDGSNIAKCKLRQEQTISVLCEER